MDAQQTQAEPVQLRLYNPPPEVVLNSDKSWAQAVDQIMFVLGQPKPPTKLLAELFGVRIVGR